tara:strand:- start:391 stop:801 length:411 start_codon:yes stop_codon:yes gene_type:complete
MLNIKQLNKIESRINEIENFLDNNRDYNKFDSNKLFMERSELEFKRNKDNINFRLSCKNKYYYAWQCYLFTQFVVKNGYKYYWQDMMDRNVIKQGISFNKYSINIGSNQYGTDIKRFNSKEELLGFVIGFNEANNL